MKIPYQLTAAVSVEKRRQNMLAAIARNLPRLQDVPIDDARTLNIACYGPSLRETWQQLRHPILSMSGATRFLAERGVVADYHVDMDPRAHKINNISPPVPGVTYLIGSVCDPSYFEALKDEKVILWHPVSSTEDDDLRWLAQADPGQLLVGTGSNVGLGAMHIGGLLGFRHFEIHGMDGSFGEDGVRHAGVHAGKVQNADQTWNAGGKVYRTSKIMANGVAETINAARLYPIFCVFHGEGLTQALIREENLPNACCADQAEKADFLRKATAEFVDVPVTQKSRLHTWSAWEAICFATPDPNWLDELQTAHAIADARRDLAKFKTGSISLETGLLLRAICHWKKPRDVVEIGTFIGKSTASLKAEGRIYTCDKDNDCVPGSDSVRVHPYTTSTAMLSKLVAEGVKADLFFFDGRLQDADLPLVQKLSAPGCVYTFDDYNPGGKGLANVAKLKPLLPEYALVEPYPAFAGRTTLAMMIPTIKAAGAVAAA